MMLRRIRRTQAAAKEQLEALHDQHGEIEEALIGNFGQEPVRGHIGRACTDECPVPEGTWRRNQAKRLQAYYALPHSLAEPALSNDIAAMLLPPQHDFEFADREWQIESSDGMLSCKPAGRTRRNREQEIRGRDNLRQQTAASILPAFSHSSSLVTSTATISNPRSGAIFWSAAMRWGRRYISPRSDIARRNRRLER